MRRLFKKRNRSAVEDALDLAMAHLRKVAAGETSYSASITPVDQAWADIVLERLELQGYSIAALTDEGVKK